MRKCLACGQPFDGPTGLGRPPVTCSPKCYRDRKNVQRRQARAKGIAHGCPDNAHGTSNGYTHFKCTCPECKRWAREYRQSRRLAARNREGNE